MTQYNRIISIRQFVWEFLCHFQSQIFQADSMSVAWRDLNKQLHMRGKLLARANDFYSSVDKVH